MSPGMPVCDESRFGKLTRSTLALLCCSCWADGALGPSRVPAVREREFVYSDVFTRHFVGREILNNAIVSLLAETARMLRTPDEPEYSLGQRIDISRS